MTRCPRCRRPLSPRPTRICARCQLPISDNHKYINSHRRFLKKPVVIEAICWTGENINAVREFMPGQLLHYVGQALGIPTLEGVMIAQVGDWIIRGIKGEFYPCKPDIFAVTYEPVEPPTGR